LDSGAGVFAGMCAFSDYVVPRYIVTRHSVKRNL
jgi:hypothetical protein